MLSGLSSLVVASTLAFHPFSPPMAVHAPEPAPDPSWDEPDEPATPAPTDGSQPVGDPADAVAPAPTTAPPPVLPVPTPNPLVMKPLHSSGLGLMIAAGATGGLAWVMALSKLAALNRCKSAIGAAVLGGGSGAVGTFGECLQSTKSMLGLTVGGWLVNDVTYGLAPAAGFYRGRYDGANAAWEGKPNRPAPVLVGVGAGLLAAGIVGRVATMVAFLRQFNLTRLFQHYPLGAHFVLQQVSAASIQAGGGLLGYGLAYKKNRTLEEGRRKAAGIVDLRLAPQVGWAYSGLSLQGSF